MHKLILISEDVSFFSPTSTYRKVCWNETYVMHAWLKLQTTNASCLTVTPLWFAMLCKILVLFFEGWKLVGKKLLTFAKIYILKSFMSFVKIINVLMVLLTLILLIDWIFYDLIFYLPVFVLIFLEIV